MESWQQLLKCLCEIHENSVNFSTRELALCANTHRLRAFRIILDLQEMSMIVRMPSAYRQRHYSFTSKFENDYKLLVEMYENFKILKKATKGGDNNE